MAAAAVGDIYQFTILGLIFNQRTMLTHFYRVLTNPAGLLEEEVAQKMLDALKDGGAHDLETPYAGCLGTAWTCSKLWAQKIHPTRLRRREENGTNAGLAGTGEVSNIHAAITLKTAKAGRDQQAVKKIGPLSTADLLVVDGKLGAPYIALLEALGQALIEEITLGANEATMAAVVYHRDNLQTKADEIDSYTVEEFVRTSRRRQVGLGI